MFVFVFWFLMLRICQSCPIGILNGKICSGHGHCAEDVTTGLDETCVCWDGYTGPDCSQRVCPSGRAWIDYATANNTAHAEYTECSNMGYCVYETGLCSCRDGFEGAACDRMRCPLALTQTGQKVECAGHGRCLSMREAAVQQDYISLWYSATYDDWDADMIFGCACDKGFGGYDCSEYLCPKGDDPLTPGVDEIQIIDCICTIGSSCNGTLALTFRGQTTKPIPMDATPELVEYYLEQLSTINDIEITFSGGERDFSLCDEFGTTALITFLTEHGDVPSLNYTLYPGKAGINPQISIFTDGTASALRPALESVMGTKEEAECSNHGTCDTATGQCLCYRGFTSSNGLGRNEAGVLGDCGAIEQNSTIYISFDLVEYPNATQDIPCPAVVPRWSASSGIAICSGVGNCLPDRTCNCTDGYEGNACEFKTCPTGEAWWDEAEFNGDRAHRSDSVCSARGLCNRNDGTCTCDAEWSLFDGNNCNQFACYVNITDECSGNGRCATMAEFAQEALMIGSESGARIPVNYSDAWDANRVRSCLCDKSPGVWDYNTSSNAYRGPFAYAYTDWTGYSCSHAFCPTGDNPFTWGENEVQAINCSATDGSFNVSFRGADPPVRIPWNSHVDKVELELESLPTIRNVLVTFADPTGANTTTINQTVCKQGGQYVIIEFISERGDLPLLYIDDSELTGETNITEVIKGTREDVECSAAGVCNREIGICNCLDGHYSGADVVPFRELGAVGQRGDCGFRHTSTDDPKWYNILFQYSYVFDLGIEEDVIEIDVEGADVAAST
uniref:EGF-like domain-containing protein n=1 Tax=Aureoumbra lagunensis TaxID=44058 RepID=A0A7S3JTR5_9STRA